MINFAFELGLPRFWFVSAPKKYGQKWTSRMFFQIKLIIAALKTHPFSTLVLYFIIKIKYILLQQINRINELTPIGWPWETVKIHTISAIKIWPDMVLQANRRFYWS